MYRDGTYVRILIKCAVLVKKNEKKIKKLNRI